mmetsp:Transcript_23815/g.32608  ORF Transcript_23815/g.32608 Transcript_23815/m.32608 type:complete len:108 (-) Transcript_23815:58-381(-)
MSRIQGVSECRVQFARSARSADEYRKFLPATNSSMNICLHLTGVPHYRKPNETNGKYDRMHTPPSNWNAALHTQKKTATTTERIHKARDDWTAMGYECFPQCSEKRP